jgi:hypothetical protein
MDTDVIDTIENLVASSDGIAEALTLEARLKHLTQLEQKFDEENPYAYPQKREHYLESEDAEVVRRGADRLRSIERGLVDVTPQLERAWERAGDLPSTEQQLFDKLD